MEHKLIRDTDGWYCSACQWKWQQKPRNECPGVKRYVREHWPTHLKTKRQLYHELGFKNPGPAVGAIWRNSENTWLYLYDPANATEPVKRRTKKTVSGDKNQ